MLHVHTFPNLCHTCICLIVEGNVMAAQTRIVLVKFCAGKIPMLETPDKKLITCNTCTSILSDLSIVKI